VNSLARSWATRNVGRLKKVQGFILLPPAKWDYYRYIKEAGALDRQHYRSTHRRLPALYRLFPERHYAAYGETLGLSPTRTFAPSVYLRLNPDVRDGGERPFGHYLRVGKSEGRRSVEMIDPDVIPAVGASFTNPADHAIVVHLYYLDLWPEFDKTLAALDIDFDLFVTLTDFGELSEQLKLRIETAYPASRVTILPNHGRDIYPFLHLVNSGALDTYRCVCKIHGKRSLHRADGQSWRAALVDELLPGTQTATLVEAFCANDEALVLATAGSVRRAQSGWGSNKPRIRELLARWEETTPPRLAPFPAGSMFWIKPPVLTRLKALGLGIADFESELGQLDGTTAHAVERLVGCAAIALGGVTVAVAELDRSSTS